MYVAGECICAMLPPLMPIPGVYAFEEVDESLPYLPLAARRVLG